MSAELAVADDGKAPSVQVDQNQQITLTLGELQTLLQAERLQATTAAIAEKINAQIKSKQVTK